MRPEKLTRGVLVVAACPVTLVTVLPQVPLTDAERAEADARPEKLALGGAGGFQARGHTVCLVVPVRNAGRELSFFCLVQ